MKNSNPAVQPSTSEAHCFSLETQEEAGETETNEVTKQTRKLGAKHRK